VIVMNDEKLMLRANVVSQELICYLAG
jgi:hypothetical protein